MGTRKTAEQERQRGEVLRQKAQDIAIKADVDELKGLLANYGHFAPRMLKFMKRMIATKGKVDPDDEFTAVGPGASSGHRAANANAPSSPSRMAQPTKKHRRRH